MASDDRQQILAKWTTAGTAAQGFIAAPGNGSTITIWDSNAGGKSPNGGARFKRLILDNFSSHASAANGVSFEESSDDGANWEVLIQYTQTAAGYDKRYVSVSAPRVRLQYINSAAVLTAWRGCLIGDEYERATQ